MTDPQTLQKLAATLRGISAWCAPDVKAEVHEAATALDAYTRILAASPDVRQIERLHSSALTRLGIEQSNQAGKDADSDRATLLDVVRRKDAEIERLRASLGMRVVTNLLAKFKEEREALWENFWGMLCISTNRENEISTALQEERERHAGTRARVEALEAYAREVETVAAAIIETGQREKYAGIDALIARAETLISEHGATVSPYYCAETSARNCPRHQNGGEKGKE